MVLSKLPVPGRPTNLDYSRARAYCTCSGCGWGCLDIFSLVYHFSFLSPSLWETARYRLKYCLKGPLSPTQPIGWLVDFGLNGPLRQYFSLPKRGRKRKERIDERKNVQTTPTRTYCKRSRPLPYYNPNCRMPRYWKFTQHNQSTNQPFSKIVPFHSAK